MPLLDCPDELLVLIIPLLDPIGLISLSQANRRFRHIIQPSKKHLAERLLSLECTEVHGGPHLDVRTRNFYLDPWTDDELRDMRWACAGCLKLLSHRHFNNHSLYRLRYRKPLPGTPATTPFTSWETSLRGKKSGQKHRFSAQPEERGFRKRFLELQDSTWVSQGTPLRDLVFLRRFGIEELKVMSLEAYVELGTSGSVAIIKRHLQRMDESRNHGFGRLKRFCNECRFQTGLLQRITNGRAGSVQAPMQASRSLSYWSPLDRWFPGFSELLDHRRPLLNSPIICYYGPLTRPGPWTLYMVRCPGCERWKELRAFRLFVRRPRWSPERNKGYDITGIPKYTRVGEFDGARCHACFAKEYGADKLGKELARWVGVIIDDELRQHFSMMRFGYVRIESERTAPQMYKTELEDILDKVYLSWPADLNDVDEVVDVWLAQYPRIKNIWDEAHEHSNWQDLITDAKLRVWVENFGKVVDNWLWLKAIREEVKQKPDVLVHWALHGRDDEDLA